MPLTPEQIETIKQIRENGGSYRDAAKAANCAPSTVGQYFPDSKLEIKEDVTLDLGETKIKEDEGGATVEFVSPRRIKTLEEAIAFGEVDTTQFYVKSWECSSWEVVMRVRQGQDANGRQLPDRPERHQLWRVRLILARIAPKSQIEAVKLLSDRYRVAEYPHSIPPFPVRPGRPVLCEIDLNDLHFGKLAWKEECGEDYDLKIAERMFRNAIQDLVAYASGFRIEEFLVPLGSDMMHIDNNKSETTNGTRVDADGRYTKIYLSFYENIIWMTEYLMAFAPVKFKLVPGNHDHMTTYFLCHALGQRFRDVDRVDVDVSPKSRKYHQYGCNLIGLMHGDHVPGDGIKVLPTIMSSEMREVWPQITNPEWHLGHRHTAKKFSTRDFDTMGGHVVRWLAALTATDKWHFDNLYVGNRKAAEMFLYDRTLGCVANFNAVARND